MAWLWVGLNGIQNGYGVFPASPSMPWNESMILEMDFKTLQTYHVKLKWIRKQYVYVKLREILLRIS